MGQTTQKTKLTLLIEYVKKGDVIITASYSKIARSLGDLLKIIEVLDYKEVSLITLKENLDTSTTQGRTILNIMTTIHQYESELLRERQAEGIGRAKMEGKYKGRIPVLRTPYITERLDLYINSSRIQNYTMKQLLVDTQLKRNTCWKFVNLRKQELKQLELKQPEQDKLY